MKRNVILSAATGVMALAMAFGTAVPAFAAEDMVEPNPVVAAHPDTTMQPTKTVTPIGSKTFYKVDAATGTVVYADRDDGSGDWTAVPSSYIDNSPYNTDNAHYGMYVTGTGADTQVHYVLLTNCHQDDAGVYTYYHGTKDAATVSEDVDTATNEKPNMSTDFYVNVENGIDPDGQHGTIRGADLIRQIELQNGVKPLTVTLGASEIKTMSLKGVTVTLPQAGIERAFIPAEYVHYDKLTGSCTVDIYQNWDYSYVPVSEEPNPERRSIRGTALADTMLTNRQPQQGDDLRSRIAYVERKAKLANAQHLAATLMTMSRGQLHTAKDFAPELHRVQQEIQAVAVRISDTKAKNKQYALAARCLTTCQTYKSVWQEYLSTGTLLKPLYGKRHSKELTAYKSALEMLERMEVRPDVDPVKVQALIQDREKQIENDTKHLAELKQTESELMAQRQTVERLQKDTEKEADTYESRI